jgi:glucan phosphoethanolaminetransferase (alkaline phosphatase superfamily)
MSKTLKIVKYQLAQSYLLGQTLLCFSVIVLNIILSFIIFRFFAGAQEERVGSIEAIALIWIFIIGITWLFGSDFKYLLSQGISRKTFFRAITLAYIILAAIWALGVTVFVMVATEMMRINMLYQMMYRNLEVTGIFAWLFAALLLLLMLGCFIALVYYRTDKRTKYIVILALFVFFGLLSVLNQAAGGVIFRAAFAVLMAAMGFSTPVPNPYIAALSMLLCTAFLCGCNFLLIRKAQLKY